MQRGDGNIITVKMAEVQASWMFAVSFFEFVIVMSLLSLFQKNIFPYWLFSTHFQFFFNVEKATVLLKAQQGINQSSNFKAWLLRRDPINQRETWISPTLAGPTCGLPLET